MRWLKWGLSFVALHTLLLLVTIIVITTEEKCGRSSDTSFGFGLACFLAMVDFPITALGEAFRAYTESWSLVGKVLVFGGLLGNLMWFVLGALASAFPTILERPQPSLRTETITRSEEYEASQHIPIHKLKQLAVLWTITIAAILFVLLLCWLITLGMR